MTNLSPSMQKERFNFQEVAISRINQDEAINILKNRKHISSNYICFPDSYTVFSAKKDPKLKTILNNSWLTMPDGKPLELFARRIGLKDVTTVSGFWTCKALLKKTKCTHYFYGSRPEVLENMKIALEKEFPEARILGYKSPPFVYLNEIQNNKVINKDIEEISQMNPDFLWIGLSSPKQDYLMAHYYKSFNKTLLLGVGGVFEYLSGDVRKSPEWIKRIGLRWLYRLLKEPKRLGAKYLFVLISYFKALFY